MATIFRPFKWLLQTLWRGLNFTRQLVINLLFLVLLVLFILALSHDEQDQLKLESGALVLNLSGQLVEQSSIDEHYSDQDPWFADPGEGADLKIEAEQMRTILARQLADMPEREAMVLQLFFVEECNLHEIGAILGIGAPRVCQIKKAALARLRMRLSDLV